MSLRLTIATVAGLMLAMVLNTSSSAFACGYHKTYQCVPTQKPTPAPVPTTAPVPPPPVAVVVIPVTPVPAPVVQVVAPQATQTSRTDLIGVKVEVCHFEPTTQRWEIRHHEQPGDRAVIEHGLCAQDRAPVPTPIPVVVVAESAPEAPVSTPTPELVDVPAMPEIVPSEPVSQPEPTPDVEVVPEPEPEMPGVPVQIPL